MDSPLGYSIWLDSQVQSVQYNALVVSSGGQQSGVW